jgi:ATP-dependent Clp protease ATP-binding subunit ClpA
MPQYFTWHYSEGAKSYLRIWKNYLEFFWRYFSISLLLYTLFYPWRRDITFRGPGFDPKEFLEALSFNLISRGVGAVVRLITIVAGLIIEAAVFGFGAFFFLVWLVLPFLVLALLFLGAWRSFAGDFFGLAMALGGAALAYLSYTFYSIGQKKLPSEMIFEEMLEAPWFDLVWERAGIDPEKVRQIPVKGIPRVLEDRDLSSDDFNEIVDWVARDEEAKEKKKMFWLKENMLRRKGLAKNWAYGYTNTLDRFSRELSGNSWKERLIGREKELEIIERVLARAEQNNILVVGEPGTGRKTIIKKFAELVSSGAVLPHLQHKRVLEFDAGAAMSGSLNSSETEKQLRMVLSEAVRAGNVILVIDDFHNFVGRQEGLGKIDISSVLMPYLSSGYVQIIALTTPEGLHRNIETEKELLKFFEKVEINELDEKKSLLILEDISLRLEERIGIRATYLALKEIVSRASQYFSEVPMPERAVDLLEEAMIYTATKARDRFLEKRQVDLILSEKTEVPIGEIGLEEKEKLANLEDILHQRVINQEEAINEIASSMRRARAGVGETKKPIGSFLFLGPTGVGKTETAKALAWAYFGSEDRMVRLDMSEYQNITDISRLIGAPEGEPGYLTTQMRENPFSLFLLDEIEKAHPNILNIFLQVFDEGFLTDGWGRKVNFRSSIIIATSNAGAELIREMVGQGLDVVAEKEKVMDFLQKNNVFKPEFLNRFDGVVVFHPLSKRHLLKVAKLMLDSLNQRLAEKKITLGITPELLEKIVELGYNPEYGARPMRRVIQDKIEDLISKKILDNSAKKGSVIEIKPEEL